MATFNRNLYRIQELVSAGEIGGLLTDEVPLHSVTFDGTPVAKQDGQLNFRGAEVVERVGTEDQIPVVGFESISLTESVGVELEDTQEWVSRQVADGFSRVRVFLRYPNGLYRYSSKGKYQSWDMNYDIEVSLDDSDWLSMVQVRSSNRTQKSFDRVHVIENPNPDRESSFYIRCRRARGAGNERETGTLFWHANVQLEASEQSYPDTAYYSIEFDAQQLGNVLPARGYHIKGIRCLVPVTYEPTLYDGTTGEIVQHAFYSSTVWDGTFKLEHCTDAAWISYNMLVNEKWGAGKSIDSNFIDIFSFWEASKYNVEMIDNGIDDPHPRFVFNGRIADIRDMRAHCDEVLATCQASTYEEDGLIKCYQDHPTVPSKIFIPANTVGGMVERQSNALENRLTVCEVTFNDRTDRFEPTTEVVEVDESLIDAYGYRIANIAQNGVTERPQAIRAARWQIENSHIEGSSATLAVGWENWDTSIGDVVYILDDVLNPDAISGRILGVNALEITLDRVVDRDVIDERMIVQTLTGLVEVIANASQGSQIVTVDSVVAAERLDALVISDDLNQYRVIGYSVSQGEKRLVCGFHDPTKYARIEEGEDYTPEYPPLDPEDILPPTQFTAFGNIADGVPSVYIDWEAPVNPEDPTLPDTRVANYILEWDGSVGRDEVTVQDTSFQIDPADLGTYDFTLTAYTTNGTPSPTVSYQLTFIPDGSSELLPPNSINANFDGKDLSIAWLDNPVNSDNSRYVPVAYIVDFSDEAASVSSSVRIPFIDPLTIHRHTYNFDDNVSDHDTPSRTIYVTIRVEDNMELLSSPVSDDFTNLAPMAPRQSLIAGLTNFTVSLLPDASLPDWESDVVGFLVEVDGDAIDVGRQSLVTFNAVPDATYNVRSAAYDVFGKTDLSWSPMDQVSTIEFPEVPELPSFSRVEYRFTGLEWTIGTSDGTIGWTEHSVTQLTWNDSLGDYERETKLIDEGSLTYVDGLNYIGLDFENGTYVRTTFDDWYDDSDYLMGEIREEDGLFSWFDEGINTLAVNAISAKHIQADAILGNNIKANEKIVIGDSKTAPNTIVLDGTATDDADPMIWLGQQSGDDGSTANFAVTKSGTVYSRQNLVVLGSATIGGVTVLNDSTIVGNAPEHTLQSGTWASGNGVGWQLTGNGQFNLRNEGGNVGLQMTSERIDVYDDSGVLKVRIGRLA
ncbi:Tip attachment protein J domain-containing protein [Vibrio crassostreae]|uniref:Phage tail protein n=1 Tax=Vibrio crassostreae TaxID=246167 RepID=A0A822MUW2_9VIBR|nr:phage tail protein [Vibrio crassostreae]CAH6958104.1 putative phage tail protein [Vibrio chagasii]MDH5950422.1 phage tail protein [Vibrio crassostreae]TCN06137.1 putative phage tail protein [Vibrio crassostreae]TCU05452.1 putative phage tail protein [Vibrio crassostreae]CAH7288197.1 putative phage tail protein [Vibrio chagasii]